MHISRNKKVKSTKAKNDSEEFFRKQTGGPLTLGRALNALRLCDEISQTEFAHMLGVSRQHLNDIEKGRRSVSLAKAIKFAKALKQPKTVFVRLALQSMIDEAGLDFKVEIAS